MASNTPSSSWSVKIISLPASITINQLAETFQLSTLRIKIPETQKTTTYFAWINDFVSEKDAKDFVDQWSDSSVFGTVIKCNVQAPRNIWRPINQHPQSNPVLPKSQAPSRLLYTNT
jgi:hypothetical protein